MSEDRAMSDEKVVIGGMSPGVLWPSDVEKYKAALDKITKLEQRVAELDSLVISLGDNNDELFKDRNQALEKIEALRITIAELQAAQTWVPVSERLPDVVDRYEVIIVGNTTKSRFKVEAIFNKTWEIAAGFHAEQWREIPELPAAPPNPVEQPSGEGVEPLGAEFESVWNANAAKLYEP